MKTHTPYINTLTNRTLLLPASLFPWKKNYCKFQLRFQSLFASWVLSSNDDLPITRAYNVGLSPSCLVLGLGAELSELGFGGSERKRGVLGASAGKIDSSNDSHGSREARHHCQYSPKLDRSHSLKPAALLEIKCGAMWVIDLIHEGIFPTLLNDSRLYYISGVKIKTQTQAFSVMTRGRKSLSQWLNTLQVYINLGSVICAQCFPTSLYSVIVNRWTCVLCSFVFTYWLKAQGETVVI